MRFVIEHWARCHTERCSNPQTTCSAPPALQVKERWPRMTRTISELSQLSCLDVTLQDPLKGDFSFTEDEV